MIGYRNRGKAMLAKKQTKSDLIDQIYEKTGNELKDIRVIVDLFLDQIKESLEKEQSVELRGFGTLRSVNEKAEKKHEIQRPAR